MKRLYRNVLFSLVLAVCPQSSYAYFKIASTPPTKPNIIIVFLDDAEMIDIGYYGGLIDTPNMDFLAANGQVHTNAYTHSICSPSRAALMTGFYAQCVGMTNLAKVVTSHPGQLGHVNLEYQMIQEWLLSQGYNTFLSGKWHVGINNHPPQSFELQTPYANGFQPLDRGFEHYVGLLTGLTGYYDSGVNRWRQDDVLINRPSGFYATDWLGDEAANFIDTLSTNNPFYLYFSPNAVHSPYHPPLDRTLLKYRLKYSRLSSMADVCTQAETRFRELGIIQCKTVESASEPNQLNANISPDALTRIAIRSAMVESIDNQIGKLILSLKRKRELHNTMIILASDNGGEQYSMSAMFDNCPLNGSKRGVREGGIHTPLIVYWPNEIQPGITNQLTHIVDVFPTIKDIITGYDHQNNQGISIKSTLTNYVETFRCIATETFDRVALICSDLWKMNLDKNVNPPRQILYNLTCDRTESIEINSSKIKARLLEVHNDYINECDVITNDSITILAACYPDCNPDNGASRATTTIDPKLSNIDVSGLNKPYMAELLNRRTVLIYEYRINENGIKKKDLPTPTRIRLTPEDIIKYDALLEQIDKDQSIYVEKYKYNLL